MGYKTASDGKVVPGTEFCTWGGYSFGPDARDLEWPDAVSTEWVRGKSAEVGWAIKANHGGGYSYRLCKVGDDGPGGVTEECFQRTPLKFASENSWVQYGSDPESNVVFKANRTTEGTYPPGSEWTMIPIPVCNSTDMGWLNPDCPNGFEFPPPRHRAARSWRSCLGSRGCLLPVDPDGRSGCSRRLGARGICPLLQMGQ